MDEEKDIYKSWLTRNITYCSDEQEMYIGYSKLKKLTVFDHYIDKYIVFDSLEAYWEMTDNTPTEYRCYEEVVFSDAPQSPVIEVCLSSTTRFSGTKIVEILRTILDVMLKIFRTHYTDYANMANIPSALNDFVIMDEIVQRDGTWYYYFHIQTTSFYFPSYYYCADFREKVCDSLPIHISSLITRPTDYIFQLVGISGSYLLSLENHKRITPYSQFLGTNTSVDRNNLFVSCFSPKHDVNAHVPLCLKSTNQEPFVTQTVSAMHSITEEQSKDSELLHNVVPCDIDIVSVSSAEKQDDRKEHTLSEFQPVSNTEQNGIHNMLGNITVLDSDEITTVDYNGVQLVAPSFDLPASSVFFITTESMEMFQPCENSELMLTVYTVIKFIAVMLAVCNKRGIDSDNCVFHSKKVLHSLGRPISFTATSSKSKYTLRTARRRKNMAYETRGYQRNCRNAEEGSLTVLNCSRRVLRIPLTRNSLTVGSEDLRNCLSRHLVGIILRYICLNMTITLCVRSSTLGTHCEAVPFRHFPYELTVLLLNHAVNRGGSRNPTFIGQNGQVRSRNTENKNDSGFANRQTFTFILDGRDPTSYPPGIRYSFMSTVK
ncbi:uncharacterized protein OCT59_012842 [Rhizophagus irregularis]|uniref:Uncharacterized protein n=1 Tax=Rhizophagus irregularis (strain DAOM 181602 / DAOM 197198 / MUCL 43194) TaxID=747089 RepID=U9UH78_RHIID|nr:hypothetical protein OCT59_012842 [Rhizophagus irregularis]GBC32021.1 hypothetical protein GLOIN_2v1483726 [Rhizophagus irregularis DAOM 181602=DAOM 197198]